MRLRKLAFALFFGFAAIAAQPVHAASIDYTFSGTFDGSLGATAYTDQAFTVTLLGDTANVTSGSGEFFNTASSASFTVGASAGTLLGSFNEVGLNPSFTGGTVVFGQGQPSAPFFVAEGLSNAALGSYDLSTVFPLVIGTISQTPGSAYLTSDGNLVFTDISSLSFEAVSPVPLPSGFSLFAVGLGLMGLLAWRRELKTKSIVSI